MISDSDRSEGLPAENLCGAVLATCRNEPGHPGDHWHPDSYPRAQVRGIEAALVARLRVILNAVLTSNHAPRLEGGADCQCVVHESARAACLDPARLGQRVDAPLDAATLEQAMWNASEFDTQSKYVSAKRAEVRAFTEKVAAEYAALREAKP